MPTAMLGSPRSPYTAAWVRPVPYGQLAAVHLPPESRQVDPAVLARLHPLEAEEARRQRGRRQVEWAGGRLAYALARGERSQPQPLLSGAGGEPIGSERESVSLSHKPDLALALVGPRSQGTLGVDLEGLARERLAIASHVLGPEEQEWYEALPSGKKWRYLVSVFALKEATYKAIFPHLRRYVAFAEARVEWVPEPRVELCLREGPVALALEAELAIDGDRVIAMVRCRP